jgi:hypothetical protein
MVSDFLLACKIHNLGKKRRGRRDSNPDLCSAGTSCVTGNQVRSVCPESIEHSKITNLVLRKLRRAVREPASAVYAECASRNEHPPHRESRCLASTRVRRALFEIIAAVFPLDNIFCRARLVGRKNSRDSSRRGVEAASRIFASAPLRFARPRDPSSPLQ